jgi:serine/threonine protein kinase
MIGKSLAHYEIIAEIGKGGMGEVYQAKDQKLGRDVAIKVLPQEFAKDADRIARFQREAKLLASLNHPNIAAIYGLEESDGTNFLVMELVDGQTLDEQIKSGPIPVEESLELALQIAEALEAAHEKGVIHRDLKPANIKVTPDSKVKVLDFGLAKAFAREQADLNLSNSPTLSNTTTQTGVILGTAAYMSPEQAKGKAVDKRTDIWSFGVVLFEMLSAEQLFRGETFSDTVAAVLTKEPDFLKLPHNRHPKIIEMLERCLEKDTKNRYHDIGDTRVDIQKILADPAGVLSKPVTPPEGKRKLRSVIEWMIATICIALAAGLIGWSIRQQNTAPSLRIPLDVDLPESASPESAPLMIISPDGKQVATGPAQDILLYNFAETNSSQVPAKISQNFTEISSSQIPTKTPQDFTEITVPDGGWQISPSANGGTEEIKVLGGTWQFPLALSAPKAFSPDGQWLAFFSFFPQWALKKISIDGLTASDLCKGASIAGVDEVTWENDGSLLFCRSEGIYRVPQEGGEPEILLKLDEDEMCATPHLLPGGEWVLFSITTRIGRYPWNLAQIAIQSLTTNERRILSQIGISPRYVPTGHLVYVRKNDLFGVPFDLETMQVQGEAFQVLDGLRVVRGNADYDFSDTGSLVYIAGEVVDTTSGGIQKPIFTIIDRKGNRIPNPLSKESRELYSFRLSPDGSQVAGTIKEIVSREIEEHIWIFDMTTGYGKQLTFGSEASHKEPVWTADGKSIVYLSHEDDGSKVFRKAVDGINEPEMLYHSSSEINSLDVSPDGTLIFRGSDALWTFNPESDNAPSEFLSSAYGPRFSPDGKWVTYVSRETGIYEVYVRPYPKKDGGQKRISVGGGKHPVWSSDGNSLFYLVAEQLGDGLERPPVRIMEVTVETKSAFAYQFPVELCKINIYLRIFEVAPSNDRFIYYTSKEEEDGDRWMPSTTIQAYLVLNWFEELKQKVPVD